MIYMIHSCNARLEYVHSYLIPALISQGIPRENIILFNDHFSYGNQRAFYNSAQYIKYSAPHEGRDVAPDRRRIPFRRVR